MVPLVIPMVPMEMPMVPLPNGTIGYIGNPMVQLATNGTIGKITNGTIGRTPNKAFIFLALLFNASVSKGAASTLLNVFVIGSRDVIRSPDIRMFESRSEVRIQFQHPEVRIKC